MGVIGNSIVTAFGLLGTLALIRFRNVLKDTRDTVFVFISLVVGLAVDERITFADLKGTLYEFAKRLFGKERQVRFRCDYFPFVEPGVEIAIECIVCRGKGCRLCGESGWIEILGSGMVNPRVFDMAGYDSSKITGFAFKGFQFIQAVGHAVYADHEIEVGITVHVACGKGSGRV